MLRYFYNFFLKTKHGPVCCPTWRDMCRFGRLVHARTVAAASLSRLLTFLRVRGLGFYKVTALQVVYAAADVKRDL
jgi:hypothetical protein